MKHVVPIGRAPVRAVVIRSQPGGRYAYTIAAMICPSAGRKASYVDQRQVYGTDDFAEAWQTARGEALKTGLPIIDLISPPRRGPSGPGGPGLKVAA